MTPHELKVVSDFLTPGGKKQPRWYSIVANDQTAYYRQALAQMPSPPKD